MPYSSPLRFDIACTTNASGNVSQTYDPGRGNFLVTGIFFDEGTAGGYTTATITDSNGMDLLNALGAGAVTADTIFTWSDLGGGLVFAGQITVAMTGAGAENATCHWRLMCVGLG